MKCPLFVLFCWWGVPLCAQPTAFSLADCLAYAFENREEVRLAGNDRKIRENERRMIRNSRLPFLSYAQHHSLSWGRNLDTETYQWENKDSQSGNVALNTGVILYAGSRIRHQLLENRLRSQKNEVELSAVKREIRLEIVQRYYEVHAAVKNKELHESFYTMQAEQEKKMERLFLAGRLSAIDRKEAGAQTCKSLAAFHTAERDCTLSLIRLKKSMNFPLSEELTLSGPDSLWFLPGCLPRELLAGIHQLPEVQACVYDSLLLERQIKQLRSNDYPVLSLSGVLWSRYQNKLFDPVHGRTYRVFDQLEDNHYKQIGFSLTIPLFNGRRTKLEAANLRINQENQQIKKRQAVDHASYEFQTLLVELNSLQTHVALLEKTEINSREIFALKQIQHEKNKLDFYELLLAENQWKSAKQELVLGYYDLQCAIAMARCFFSSEILHK